MELICGLDISDMQPKECRRLKTPWTYLSNRWSTHLCIMSDNSILITISTKIPMKLTKFIVELNIKMYENVEFIIFRPFGISFPRIDYIKSLTFHMETDMKDYKYVSLKEEFNHCLKNLQYIHCLDNGKILNVNDFIQYLRVTNHEERRKEQVKKCIAHGYKPLSKEYQLYVKKISSI